MVINVDSKIEIDEYCKKILDDNFTSPCKYEIK